MQVSCGSERGSYVVLVEAIEAISQITRLYSRLQGVYGVQRVLKDIDKVVH